MTTHHPMTSPASVVLTVAGDAGSIETEADTALALAAMVPAWAAQVSSARPEDLVVVRGTSPARTPATSATRRTSRPMTSTEN